jgi:hypothetical protein
LGFFGLYPKNTASSGVISQNIYSIYHFFARTFIGTEGVTALIIFILIILGTVFFAVKSYKSKSRNTAFWLVIINLVVAYVGLFIHGDPPEHYYLAIFPIPIILASYLITKIFKKGWAQVLFSLLLGSMGLLYLIQSNWFYSEKVQASYQNSLPPYQLQLAADNAILKDAGGQEFALKRIGTFDYFENNFANNYIYILTIRGAKIKSESRLSYTIVEGTDVGEPTTGKRIWSEGGLEIWKSSP